MANCSCHRAEVFYTSQVRLNPKFICLCGLAASLALVTAGCGGISASRSVSPLDFFLPGILKNDAPATTNSVAAVHLLTPVGQVPAGPAPVEIVSVR